MILTLAVLVLSQTWACRNDDSDPKSPPSQSKVQAPAPISDIDAELAKADELRLSGHYADARKIYENVIAVQKNNLKAIQGAKLIDVTPESFAKAISLKKKAKNEQFLGRPIEAYRLIKDASILDPNNIEIATLRGSSALIVHRYHEAARIFRTQFENDRSRVDSLIGWAEAAFGCRDFEQCLQALDHMDLIEAQAEHDDKVARHLTELWYTKGIAASALFLYDIAIDVLNRAAKREPLKARFRDALAAAHLEAGHFDHALAELKELGRIAPGTKLLHYRQGKALERMGKKPEAVAAYREALRRDQSAWQVAIDCARAYEAMGGKDNLLLALSFLDHALKFNPRSHEALFTQQAVYRKLGNKDESRRVNGLYQNLIDFKAEREKELRNFKSRVDKDPHDYEAWLGTINIRSRFNPVEDVLRDVHKMLNVAPEHPDALWHLTNLLLVQKKNQEAYFQAAKLMDTNPKDSRGYSLVATALFRLNRTTEATKFARQAYAMNARDGSALEILVRALQKSDPQSEELATLMPMFKRMKSEEEALMKQMQAKEDELNRSLGK